MDTTLKKPLVNRKILSIALMFLIGAAAGGFLGSYLARTESMVQEVPLPLLYKLSVILWLPVAILLPLAVHELGHVLAGLSQKFEFRSFTVALLHFYKEDGRLKFKWLSNMKGFMGLAVCLPRSGQSIKQLATQFAVYGAGGPVASLFFAAVLLVPYFVFRADVTKAEPFRYLLVMFCMVCGYTSLFFFVVTIIPAKANGFYTDGGRILNILRGGKSALLDLTILNITAASCSGILPEKLDRSQLEEAILLQDDSVFSAYCHYYLYLICLRENEVEKAAFHLQQFAGGIDKIPDIAKSTVWLEQAFFEAFYNHNPELAKEFYAKVKPSGFISKDVYLRTEAAIALAENQPDLALQKATQALAELPNNMDRGAAIAYKQWLQAITEAAQTHKV